MQKATKILLFVLAITIASSYSLNSKSIFQVRVIYNDFESLGSGNRDQIGIIIKRVQPNDTLIRVYWLIEKCDAWMLCVLHQGHLQAPPNPSMSMALIGREMCSVV